MKHTTILLIAFILVYSIQGCSSKKEITAEQKEKLAILKKEIKDNLTTNLLPYWSSKMIDTINGGFYGRVDAKEQVYPDADKGGILNARILWTFSSAFRVLGDSSNLHIATRAKDYILKYFIDKEYGGGYMTVKANGEPGDMRKGTLTESYFIYAFAEYYRATADKEVLDEAIKIFDLLEKYALDREYNGYFEVYTREWQRSHDRLLNEKSDKEEKTMISHLHLVEAYAGLYRVWPDERMEARLQNVLEVFNDKIVDKKTFHTIYFLDRQWNATTQIDSYGHDIEASWLMVEAARLLKDPELIEEVESLSIKVADAAAEGLQPDGSLLTEKNRETGHIVTIRSWWEQAETIVGYLNAFEITGDESYLDKAVNGWNYTKKYFVDYRNGGWFSLVDEKGVATGRDKANYWTCPYHNGRMCMEVIEMIKE
ncbi:MAG TPA: AGE family epimerase/isomerase [Bacteroidales bacterium]|nr:AGE family epimerase/isomerase [Bacteroidales bacterium]